MISTLLSNQEQCEQKRLSLSALPRVSFPVVNVMLDLTLACNLRCRYCFKEKGNTSMSLRVAQDAVIWLIYASGSTKKLNVFFMGGEPLLRRQIIEKIIPFAKIRAKSHGKEIRFSVTTNGTLVSDEFVAFAKESGLHFHLSFDGCPEVQDHNRPLATGKKSSPLVEEAAKKILKDQPGVMARGCVSPDNVSNLLNSFRYFREHGFTTIGLFPCESSRWTQDTLDTLETQFDLVAEDWTEAFRNLIELQVAPLEKWFTKKERGNRGTHPCGAGRGMTLIDVEGGIWPCSRFSSHDAAKYRLGSIYEEFDDSLRKQFLEGCSEDKFYPECKDCTAKKMCEGGCLVENLEETGDMFVYSPNDCEILRIYSRVGTKMHDVLYAEKNPLFMKKYYPKEWKETGESASSHE